MKQKAGATHVVFIGLSVRLVRSHASSTAHNPKVVSSTLTPATTKAQASCLGLYALRVIALLDRVLVPLGSEEHDERLLAASDGCKETLVGGGFQSFVGSAAV